MSNHTLTDGARVAVLTSGGDAPGMNAAIRAAVKTCLHSGFEPVGVLNGIQGLLEADFIRLGLRDTDGISRRGGTVLGTARVPGFEEAAKQQIAIRNLVDANIAGLLILGGNGSMRAALALSKFEGMIVGGAPFSIDGDMPATRTIGEDSATNTLMGMVDTLSDTTESHHRVQLLEAMGRKCGRLAMKSALTGEADLAIYPERHSDRAQILSECQHTISRLFSDERQKRGIIIVVSEAIGLNGIITIDELAAELQRYVSGRFSTSASVRRVVPGHLQRGGSPSSIDRRMAQRAVVQAIMAMRGGSTGFMTMVDGPASIGRSTPDEKIRLLPLAEAFSNGYTPSGMCAGQVEHFGKVMEILTA